MLACADTLTTSVAYDVPADVAFAYLADPRNRPEWQSSLRAVELLDEGEPRVGMRWRDLTVGADRAGDGDHRARARRAVGRDGPLVGDPGRPDAGLLSQRERLRRGGRRFRVHGRGLLRPVGWVATARRPARRTHDLRTAARILPRGRADGTHRRPALSVLMVLAGLLFTFQGLGYIKGSAMTGVEFWAIVGPAIAGFGIALGIVALRGPR